MTMTSLDNKVFKQVRESNEEAFHKVFTAYYTRFHMFVTRCIRDALAAKDIVQDFFIRYWQKRRELDFDKTAFARYAYRSLFNASMNYLRDKREVSDDFMISLELMQDQDSDEEAVAELVAGLKSAIDQLPPRCKDIFVAAKIKNKSYAEIAEHFNISENTVKVQVSKAYRILREKLN